LEFGIFRDLLEPLNCKIENLTPEDQFCTMSIDEMEISSRLDFDKNEKKFYGNVTLGDPTAEATHILTVVLIRGIKNPWKQIVATVVTGNSTDTKIIQEFIEQCFQYVESKGLYITSMTSDMGPANQGLWSQLGCVIQKHRKRQNTFSMNRKY
jgi:hypothetical protein